MTYLNKLNLRILVLVLCIVPQLSLANLLIHPTRVNFTTDQRSQIITLANTSQKTTTYQLQWSEKVALRTGGYREMQENEKSQYPIVSQFLRFSPRQVTLKPGERQSVKLLLRRTRDLSEGEYRSHLLFKALPTAVEKDSGPQNNPTMTINMILNFAIPVALRVGEYDVDISADKTEVIYDPINNAGNVFVELTRNGLHSPYGDMSAWWTPSGGQEYLLAKSTGLSLWAEESDYRIKLVWATKDFKPGNGRLRLEYQGTKIFKNFTYVDKVFDFTRDQITVIEPAPETTTQ